eukprot:COSAG06_NODE_2367_length_7000_cov_16.568179_7_plen_58_part_00
MIILPRQARDKHTEKLKKDAFFLDFGGNDGLKVRKNGLFEPFKYKCDLFTKAGSGQT